MYKALIILNKQFIGEFMIVSLEVLEISMNLRQNQVVVPYKLVYESCI